MENKEEKRIEVLEMRIGDLKEDFGNPRTITKKRREELKKSMEMFGDFGLFLIDEDNNLIAGNQRASILKEIDEDTMVLCKKLIGYTDTELKAINIKDNTHAGDWDFDLLADWNADILTGLGMDIEKETIEPSGRSIDEMELIHYEKYDYVLIACKDELSYNSLIRTLGIEEKKVLIGPKKRPIKGRAIWFDDMKVDFVPKGDK